MKHSNLILLPKCSPKFFQKTVLVPTLQSLYNLLHKRIEPYKVCIYADRIAIKHHTINKDTKNDYKTNIIRIWKTTSFLNIWYNRFSTTDFIGALDYTIQKDFVKIDYLCVNNIDEYNVRYKDCKLTDEETIELKKNLIQYIKNIAQEENKSKIIVDIHNNLRFYNKYYVDEGFVVTDRKCTDNPYWLEAEYDSEKDLSIL